MLGRRRSLLRIAVALALAVPAGIAASASPSWAAVTCPARTGLSYWNANFFYGTSIPYTDTYYVNQGLAYYPAKDWLITTLLDERTSGAMRPALGIRSRDGSLLKRVYVQTSGGATLKGHMGGVSVAGGSLLLSTDNGNADLFRFSMGDLVNAANNGTVRANGAWTVGKVSYSSVQGDYLYVGAFVGDLTGTATMYRYHLTAAKAPELNTRVSISTPTRVQGLAVADGYYIFSTSYGKGCYSHLKFRNIGNGRYGRAVEIPPMSEGIVNVPRGAAGYADDWLYVVFESGSKYYAGATMPQVNFNRTDLTALTPATATGGP